METYFENFESDHTKLARERVMTDLKSLVRDSENLLKATAGDVSEKAKEMRERMAATVERAKSTCEDMQQQTALTTKAAVKKADTVIRAHPYESLGLTFGVGLLIGVLVTRR